MSIRISGSPRTEHYLEVYQNARFVDFDRLRSCFESLERKILDIFQENLPLVKLVGSSSTGTMRKSGEDLDCAVAFQDHISNEDFLSKIKLSGLQVTDINQNQRYGYLKVSGKHEDMDFVLVPLKHPNGDIKTYEQDAFYHPEFINSRRYPAHAVNVILMKEFFEQIGVYKEVKGISCEMMSLCFKDFDVMLQRFANSESLRVNMSPSNLDYPVGPLVVDYPFLGRRSFTEKVTPEMYAHIRNASRKLIADYKFLKIKQK